MSIRQRLGLVLGLIVVSFVVVLVVGRFKDRVVEEVREVQVQALRVLSLAHEVMVENVDLIAYEIDLRPNNYLHLVVKEWEEKVGAFERAFTDLMDMRGIVWLPAELRDNLMKASRFWEEARKGLPEISEGIARIVRSELLPLEQTRGLMEVHRYLMALPEPPSDLVWSVQNTWTKLKGLNATFQDFVGRQLAPLSEEITHYVGTLSRTASLVQIGVSVAVLLSSGVFVFLVIHALGQGISSISQGVVHVVEEKDLTASLEGARSDELGRIREGFNTVVREFRGFLTAVSNLVEKVAELHRALSTSSEEVVASVEEINRNLASLQEVARGVDRSSQQTLDAIDRIHKEMATITEETATYAARVDESTAALEKVHALVRRVSELSSDYREQVLHLVRQLEVSGEKVRESASVVGDIHSEVHKIQEIIEIINTIASQTNLLSINAAIESAHAGEYGKGFSVVAEEIRKLAESSSQYASRIEGSLRKIVEEVSLALKQSEGSEQAYHEVSDLMRRVEDALGEIMEAIHQLADSTGTVHEVLRLFSEGARRITEGVRTITKETEGIHVAAQDARSRAETLSRGMDEIALGGREILQAVTHTRELAQQTATVVASLRDHLSLFRIE
ncbi:methyl-accepting chemotaxis protein [Spirochaeta thermophila]|uniref:Methyl-accepting chemotaxis sensory transducer n=1 Tax=Winmispira thermophila (strain ATCC 49972 / DSM 6192 / RI 19.B1) TaxID=665571 RepID=E0RNW5_WINT6|nr:methyl-accepting chemotaxis protein [Spirochaeta thermophila]ADN01238.1 putative protein involved in chemotaxis signal transduction [Spirochaeta thermophila DSM 6192]